MTFGVSKLLKGGSLMAGGQAVSQILSFVRNAIIGRMISQEDFGIAATFTITVSLFELLSYTAADKVLVQAQDGDNQDLQNVAHLVTISRGLVGGGLVFLLAPLIAKIFAIENATWAFRWLALVPLLRGFVHLDVQRYQRFMRFSPIVFTELIPQFLMVLAVYPLVKLSGDYSAVLWLVILQSGVFMLVTHFYAERPYKIFFTKVHLERIFSFGWPLLINGLLMFGIFQGDKIIVGNMYSIAALGAYSAAFMVTMAPAMLIAKTSSALFLPLLARSQNTKAQFTQRYVWVFEFLVLLSGLSAIFFILCGGRVLPLLFGQNYIGYGAIVGWLGVMWAVRILRVAPTTAAMALGDTKNTMIGNCVRSVAVVFGVFVGLNGLDISMLAASGALGEILALFVTVWFLQKFHRLRMNLCFSGCTVFVIASLVCGVIAYILKDNSHVSVIILICALVSLAFGVLTTLMFEQLRNTLLKSWISATKR